MTKYILKCAVFLCLLPGCAVLYHVQVGQIDNRKDEVLVPFEILMSETGVSTREIGQIAKSVGGKNGRDAGKLADTVAMFQIGPRTGEPVYDEHYAEKLVYEIHQKCPSGKVTGLTSIRETRKYPVISGEIVKVTGFCKKTKTQAPVEVGQLGDF